MKEKKNSENKNIAESQKNIETQNRIYSQQQQEIN